MAHIGVNTRHVALYLHITISLPLIATNNVPVLGNYIFPLYWKLEKLHESLFKYLFNIFNLSRDWGWFSLSIVDYMNNLFYYLLLYFDKRIILKRK